MIVLKTRRNPKRLSGSWLRRRLQPSRDSTLRGELEQLITRQQGHTEAIVRLQTQVENGLTSKVQRIENRVWALMTLAIATLLSVVVPLLV